VQLQPERSIDSLFCWKVICVLWSSMTHRWRPLLQQIRVVCHRDAVATTFSIHQIYLNPSLCVLKLYFSALHLLSRWYKQHWQKMPLPLARSLFPFPLIPVLIYLLMRSLFSFNLSKGRRRRFIVLAAFLLFFMYPSVVSPIYSRFYSTSLCISALSLFPSLV